MSGYIGTQPVPQATQTRDVFTATSGQTSFATSGYTPNFLDVWLNGVKLVNGDDFTATNGSDVVLTSGATTGDTVEVLAYTAFSPANVYTIAEADAAFATAAQGDLADTAVQPNDSVTLGAVTATSFSGDGSAITNLPSSAPTTADVLSATAGASAGAVGTYAWARGTSGFTLSFGSTYAGSSLKSSGILDDNAGGTSGGANNWEDRGGSTLSGTWRCMGTGALAGYYHSNIFLRIA